MPLLIREHQAQVDFGFGDVRVGPALTVPNEEHPVPVGGLIIFPADVPEPLGTVHNYDETKEFGIEDNCIRLIFHDVRAIDGMRRALDLAEAMMISGDLEAGRR